MGVQPPELGRRGGKGVGNVFPALPLENSFENSFVSIRVITKTLSANRTWHIKGPQNIISLLLTILSVSTDSHLLTPVKI